MSYKFLKSYSWSPNGIIIQKYEEGSIHADLPGKLIKACENEKYLLLEIINDAPPVHEAKVVAIPEVKIEPEPENKIEPALEKKTVYPIFGKKGKKK